MDARIQIPAEHIEPVLGQDDRTVVEEYDSWRTFKTIACGRNPPRNDLCYPIRTLCRVEWLPFWFVHLV